MDADEEPLEDDDLLEDDEGEGNVWDHEGEGDARPGSSTSRGPRARGLRSEFLRAPNEDDDGYDPYSDRPARREPLFERDPWD